MLLAAVLTVVRANRLDGCRYFAILLGDVDYGQKTEVRYIGKEHDYICIGTSVRHMQAFLPFISY